MVSLLRKYKIIKRSKYDQLRKNSPEEQDFKFLKSMPLDKSSKILTHIDESRAQLRQDLLALVYSDFKENGFFVEFGATNGVQLSNTHLLEKKFNWAGILAEPARTWHHDLKNNRSATLDTRCVWKSSGETLSFDEVADSELSTISDFSDSDFHKSRRKEKTTYNVETISLFDLLQQHGAPNQIDYLSIDTEGSEYSILEAFDFASYDIRLITCEHNFTDQRSKIFDLLTKNGYERIHADISMFDDWYIKLGD